MFRSFCSRWFKFCMAYVVALSVCFQGAVFAFDGPTHEYVTITSLNILCKMDGRYKDFYNESAVKNLKVFCVMPDKDENAGLYKDHFYNVATGHNFMGERMSALFKVKVHYSEALLNYKSGNLTKAWEELGRALHFLEDVITPVHAGYDCPMDAVNKLGMHVDFEKKCVMVQRECVADVNSSWLKYFVDNPIDDIGKMCSRIAGDNFFSLEKGYISKDKLARMTIVSAQKVVVGMLYRFFVEAQGISVLPESGSKGGEI